MIINIEDFIEAQKNSSINIIDIRNKYQYDLGHIDRAKNISMSNLLTNPKYYLNKADVYYIYCQCGTSSKKVVDMLNNLGYRTISITGGYNSYQKIKSS